MLVLALPSSRQENFVGLVIKLAARCNLRWWCRLAWQISVARVTADGRKYCTAEPICTTKSSVSHWVQDRGLSEKRTKKGAESFHLAVCPFAAFYIGEPICKTGLSEQFTWGIVSVCRHLQIVFRYASRTRTWTLVASSTWNGVVTIVMLPAFYKSRYSFPLSKQAGYHLTLYSFVKQLWFSYTKICC